MTNVLRAALLGLGVLCALGWHGAGVTSLVFAEDAADEGQRARIQGWLRDLRSDAFKVRRQAREGLLREGAKALDLLRPLVDDPDAEVRDVVQRVLRAARGEAPPEVPGALRLPWQVDLRVPEQSAFQRLQALASRYGGSFARVEGFEDETPLPAGHLRGSYAEVLESLMSAGKLVFAEPFDNTGRGLLGPRDEASPEVPRATAGPLIVDVQEVSVTRSLVAPGPPRYGLTLRIRWVPCVQVVQLMSPRIERAVDPQGVAFTPYRRTRQATNFGLGATQTERTIPVTLVGGRGHTATLQSLTLKIPVRMRAGRQRADFALRTDASGALVASREGEQDPARDVRVARIAKQGSESRPQYVFDIEAEMPRARHAATTGFAVLTWASGRRQRLHTVGQRRADQETTLRSSARAYGAKGDAPASLAFIWYEESLDHEAVVTLGPIPLGAAPR